MTKKGEWRKGEENWDGNSQEREKERLCIHLWDEVSVEWWLDVSQLGLWCFGAKLDYECVYAGWVVSTLGCGKW